MTVTVNNGKTVESIMEFSRTYTVGGGMTQLPLPGLQALNDWVIVRELPNGLGFSAEVKGDSRWGSCWGSTPEDAAKSMEWFVFDNKGSMEVVKAI